jgi:hypothetical protein
MEGLCLVFTMILLVIAVIMISGALLYWACKLAKIEDATYWGAVGTAFLIGLLTSIVGGFLRSSMPEWGPFLGAVSGFLLEAFVISGMFKATYGRSLWATLIHYAIGLFVFGALALLLLALGVGGAMLGG